MHKTLDVLVQAVFRKNMHYNCAIFMNLKFQLCIYKIHLDSIGIFFELYVKF